MPPLHPRRSFLADRGDAGDRLDRVLVRHLADLGVTRVQAARWVRDGKVAVEAGVAEKPAQRVWKGQRLTVELPPPPADAPPLLAEEIALRVVWEDEHLLAVDKPAGLVVHPTWGHRRGTLLNGLLWQARDWAQEGLRPRLVHRLDKDTSGLLLVAKSRAAHAGLARALQRRQVAKTYLAVAWGRPAAARGRVDAAIGRDPLDPKRRVAGAADGRPSVTDWELLADGEVAGRAVALLCCRPLTGRTHQIRVHLAAAGLPLVGDPLYGSGADAALLQRQALHAWRLQLAHPVSQGPLELTAPPPADLCRLLAAAGLAAPAPVPA
jgi:23S rRNA pseudouridine1911/1915/1917 synthase